MQKMSTESRFITTKEKELQQAIKDQKCRLNSTGKPTYSPSDKNKITDLLGSLFPKI